MEIITTKDLPSPKPGGSLRLYTLSDGTHVVTSAIPCAFDTGRPETFVFAADEDGRITDWLDLEGSFQGDMDHDRAIQGYLASFT